MGTMKQWQRRVLAEAELVEKYCCERTKKTILKMKNASRTYEEICGFLNLSPEYRKPPAGRLNPFRVSSWIKVYVGHDTIDVNKRGRFGLVRKSMATIVSEVERELENITTVERA